MAPSDDDHGSTGGADHSASFGCVVALCVLAGVATLAHIGDSEEQLEYSHQRESVSDKGYKEGRVAQATFRGGAVEGLVVFREGNVGDPTKIVVGISGLEWLAGEEGFEWYLSGGADRACVGGRFETAELPLNTLLSEEPGSGWDMTERHGALEPMALAASGSVVARVMYDPSLPLAGDHSAIGRAVILRKPGTPLLASPCATIVAAPSLDALQDRAAAALPEPEPEPEPEGGADTAPAPGAEPPPRPAPVGESARGVCVFDVDMTLTCGGNCSAPGAPCDYADPAAAAGCLDIAVTRGFRDGYPLMFNMEGTRSVLRWCGERGYATAIATHGNHAEISHVGECALPKMEYVTRLLQMPDDVDCRDVRGLRRGEGTRCVYGGSDWTPSGVRDKVPKDVHVQGILNSLVAPAPQDFAVVFFDDSATNRRDVLRGNYTVRPAEGGEAVPLEKAAVRAVYPNTATLAPGWGNPASCGLVVGEIEGLEGLGR